MVRLDCAGYSMMEETETLYDLLDWIVTVDSSTQIIAPEPCMSLQKAALRGNTAALRYWANCREMRPVAGDTPLHYAARAGDLGTVEELLMGGADANACNDYFQTPLVVAAVCGHTGVLNVLLEHDLQNKQVRTSRGVSGVYAFDAVLSRATAEARGADAARALLAAGAAAGADGPRTLRRAAAQGHAGAVRALLEAGAATVNGADGDGCAALHLAAGAGAAACVALLLGAGADHGARDSYGRTPLHHAAQAEARGAAACVALLLLAGAAALARDEWGEAPVHAAAARGNQHALALLVGSQCENNHSWENTELLLTPVGTPPRAQGEEALEAPTQAGRTPLHLAAGTGSTQCVAMLMAAGADSSKLQHNGRGALHLAAVRDFPRAVRALLAAGADPRLPDSRGDTARRLAERVGSYTCAALLAAAEARLSVLTDEDDDEDDDEEDDDDEDLW